MSTCKSVIVGQPYSSCWDIANAAGVTVNALTAWNIGLNCNSLQPGQRICVSAGPITAPNSDGSCQAYRIASGDSCYAIGLNFGANSTTLESWNKNTYHWRGCSNLAPGLNMCVSSGTPPPVPVNPDVQCGPESSGNVTCPLKACCSAFGFCGTTTDFCSAAPNGYPCNSNCFIPTLPSCSGSNLVRKVGYYAGWGARRSCQAVSAKQVSLSGLTHVLFSFGTISSNMQLVIDSNDVQPLKDLVARKGSVKVMIAVGGWAFSQDDPTRTLFSVMIGSSSNRATFIASAKSFISQYGLDGIDIDMEYPASVERQGPPSDTPNLTAFFKELRAALPSTTISLATPAGFWFMKGYELDKIAPYVTFINLMSYDYHGPWDLKVQGEDSTAKPQTSITDIKDSVLLYRRIGIDMAQVNLGLAYYGRTFKLADPSCGKYGCKFTDGGTKGACTDASGILSYSEISRLSNFKNAVYNKTTETKFFMQGSDLVTFDDKDTWAAKTTFAGSTCFGGTMVWSLDQVDQSAVVTPGKPCTDAATWAKDRIQSFWKTFTPWLNSGGSIPGACGCFQDSDALWHDVINMEAMVNWMIQSGTTDYDRDVITSQTSDSSFTLTPSTFHGSHDDALWTVILYMILGDFQEKIGNAKDNYWKAALTLLDWVGEDTGHHSPNTESSCDGGVWWVHDNNDSGGYKNAITNALYIQACARASLKGKGSQYLDKAKAAWSFSVRMRDSDGLYNDGTRGSDCHRSDETKWTYNQGAFVAALGALYKATGDKNYINEGLVTIDAVISKMTKNGVLREGCDVDGSLCNFDQVDFKGLTIRHFGYFFDYVNDSSVLAKYSDWLGAQAKAINDNARDGSGQVTSVWCDKNSSRSQKNGKSDVQRSALDAVLVAMKYGTGC